MLSRLLFKDKKIVLNYFINILNKKNCCDSLFSKIKIRHIQDSSTTKPLLILNSPVIVRFCGTYFFHCKTAVLCFIYIACLDLVVDSELEFRASSDISIESVGMKRGGNSFKLTTFKFCLVGK